MKLINLNYVRGLYDFLFARTDEELEGFDINLVANQNVLFDEMRRSFSSFGPISKQNIVDGLNVILQNCFIDDFWRKAIPHDLPLSHVLDRRDYLTGIISALTNRSPSLVNEHDFVLVDEVGPQGLDFSE